MRKFFLTRVIASESDDESGSEEGSEDSDEEMQVCDLSVCVLAQPSPKFINHVVFAVATYNISDDLQSLR